MYNIMLHVFGDQAQESRLQCALDLVRLTQAHLHCVQTLPIDPYVTTDLYGGAFIAAEILTDIRAEQAKAREAMEARLQAEGVSWSWSERSGDPVRSLIREAKLADAVLISQSAPDNPELQPALPLASDLVLASPAPVFIIPQSAMSFQPGDPALICWNGSSEGARALRLAMPFLARASSVHVLQIDEPQDLFPATEAGEYLSRHGIEADIHLRQSAGEKVDQVILETARMLRAGYIVLGAYGHSRMREALLGGVTRNLLAHSDIPLLMAH
ncbi:MAG: universal stress protein [Sphingobium sp.]|nr:universal stress protein [Sphingobium sp.]